MQIALDEWQQKALAHKGDLLLCTGRRVGKTYILCRKAAEYMVKRPSLPIIVVSLTEDQAMLIISMTMQYLQENYPKMIAKGKHKPTQRQINLTNKSKMISRPVGNTGDGARGFEGGVLIVDEASRMPSLFWRAALPVILTYENAEVWLASTPFGKQGYFWDRYDEAMNKKDPEARFRCFHVTSEQVMQDRVISSSWTEGQRANALKRLKQDKDTMSELEFGQEYLGLFLDELRRFFSDELIEKACVLKRREHRQRGKSYHLGVDIARMGNDETTYEILEKINSETIEHVESIVRRKQLTTQTESDIIVLCQQYDDIVSVAVDAGSGSLGVGVFDHLLKEETTRRKVVAINNRAIAMDREGKSKQKLLKEDLYDNMRSLMEKNVLKLLDDASVRISLASVQWEFVQKETQSGYQATSMRIFGDYTHIVEGLIRAAWMAKEQRLNMWVKSIRI